MSSSPKAQRRAAISILAISLAHNRLGYVFLYDNEVMDWGVSETAARGADRVQAYTRKLLDTYAPDLVISEDSRFGASRRGTRTLGLIHAVQDVVQRNQDCQHAVRPRLQPFANKYEQAIELAKKHPVLETYVPKQPPIWMPERRNILIFEALALADQVICEPKADAA